jgi:hypothetical protein
MPFLPERRDQRLTDEARSEDGMDVGRAPGERRIELTEREGRVRLGCSQRLEIRQRGRFGGLEVRKRMRHGQKSSKNNHM